MGELETERRIATLEVQYRNIEARLDKIDKNVQLLLRREDERRGASHAVKLLWGMGVAAISLATTWFTLWLRNGGHH